MTELLRPSVDLMMESSVEAKSRQGFKPEVLTAKQPDFASQRDDVLLSYMARQDDDFDLAEGACSEFYRRHYQFIVAFCRQRRWEAEGHPVEEWVDRVFLRAWEYAKRFRSPPHLSQEKAGRTVRSWLLQIAKRTFIDILRGIPNDEIVPMDDVLFGSDADDYATPPNLIAEQVPVENSTVTSERKGLVCKFIEETDLRTRAILTAIGDHWDCVLKQSKFPQEVTEALCKEFSMTKESLGTYRARALKALENYINENEQPKRTA